MGLDELKDVVFVIVVIAGCVALLGLLCLFLSFLWRAWVVLRVSWQPQRPRALCACGAPLPGTPTLAAASEEGTLIFGFTCQSCGKTTSIPAAKPST